MTKTIVVGVDGSTASKSALRWATDEAVRRDVTVRAVMVHMPQGQFMIGAVPYDVLPPGGIAAEHKDCIRRLGEIVDGADGVEQVVVAGKPGEELVKASADADLLVVGSHGSRWSELVLGSVSSYCTRHATCPVVVLPRHAWQSEEEGKRDGGAHD